jgi:hypothetical protein
VTRPRAGNQEIAVRLPSEACSFYIPYRTLAAVYRPADCPMGADCSFPRLKRSGREADHMSLSGAEFKNDWMCTSISAYVLMPCTDTTLIYANKIYRDAYRRDNELMLMLCIALCCSWTVGSTASAVRAYAVFRLVSILFAFSYMFRPTCCHLHVTPVARYCELNWTSAADMLICMFVDMLTYQSCLKRPNYICVKIFIVMCWI